VVLTDIVTDSKTKLDIRYGFMHIQVVSGFISGYQDITRQHW
jgi:hypothetical protein